MSVTLWLTLLTALFAVRVVGQIVAGLVAPEWLPDFDAFDSGVLPYSVLLGSQVVILAVQVRIILAHHAGTVRERTSLGRVLFAFGIAYAVAMLVRAVVTIVVYGREWWWHGAIPIVFHWVLAGFVMVLARFHLARAHIGRPVHNRKRRVNTRHGTPSALPSAAKEPKHD